MNKKTIIGLVIGILLFGGILRTSNTPNSTTPNNPVIAPTIETPSKNTITSPVRDSSTKPTAEVTSDRYYINVDGNKVQSPTYSQNGSVPAGATARCRDGTYSFSQHRSGTCSHHGGVASWL